MKRCSLMFNYLCALLLFFWNIWFLNCVQGLWTLSLARFPKKGNYNFPYDVCWFIGFCFNDLINFWTPNLKFHDSIDTIYFFFQDEKAVKLSALNARIEEVIAYKESLICERKELMHDKMAKAEAKRQEHLFLLFIIFIIIFFY